MVWLPVFGIFNVCTDVDACNCTQGLCGHSKRVCIWNWLWEKNPSPHQGLEPLSVLHLAFQSDALPTKLFFPPQHARSSWVCCQVNNWYLQDNMGWFWMTLTVPVNLSFLFIYKHDTSFMMHTFHAVSQQFMYHGLILQIWLERFTSKYMWK